MATNYDAIRNANIREYGEGIRHLEFLGRLYTDRTHFLFELLQNAEDAHADHIHFDLRSDRLLVRHTGRPFTEDDVRGICGVAEGTKDDDLTKIGKFGIGFKAVYAFTCSPEVHSGDESFRIDHYVRPFVVERQELQRPWTTLFVFPFDHTQVTPQQAFGEISQRLQTLSERVLLFLRNIYTVTWQVEEGPSGHCTRNPLPGSTPRRVRVSKMTGLKEASEEWVVLDREIRTADVPVPVRVEVAFRLVRDERRNTDVIAPVSDSQLVVFFPTEKETHLGFLVQGPYRTTPARDNVPQHDAWNQCLVEETAELLADALLRLQDGGLLDVGLLSALPIRKSDFPTDGMFYRLFHRVRELLRDEPLLPAASGDRVRAGEARIARGAGLVELLSPHQLRMLCNAPLDLHWLSEEITRDRAPDLYQYLLDHRAFWLGRPTGDALPLESYEIRPETLARNLTGEFLAQQDDVWMAKLYAFLLGQSSLWKRELADKPILRLQDGSHIRAFRADGSPNAYLPSASETNLPVVKPALAEDADARQFLFGLGLREPDIVSDVLENVLPKYLREGRGESQPATDEHIRDVGTVLNALAQARHDQRQALLDRLRTTPFLHAINATGTATAYKRPIDLYARTSDLESYFAGNDHAWFVAEPNELSQSDSFRAILGTVGVEHLPRSIRITGSLTWEQRRNLRLSTGNDGSTGNEEIWDFDMDGLDLFLRGFHGVESTRTFADAHVLWDLLLARVQATPASERSQLGLGRYRWWYRTAREVKFKWTTWVDCLRSSSWVPSRDGTLHRPGDLSIGDIPTELAADSTLITLLGIGSGEPSRVDAFAREQGVDPATLRLAVRLAREHPEELVALQRRVLSEPSDMSIDGQAADPSNTMDGAGQKFNYTEELARAFARPQANSAEDLLESTYPVSNPERRRHLIQEDIETNQRDEPRAEERFVRVPRKVWEAKNGAVRIFLREQYGGRCQICEATFPTKDGDPYFEGIYLVSRIHFRWLDRPGNVLCLCPTCAAKFLHGSVEANGIITQIESFQGVNEGGFRQLTLRLRLCGKDSSLRFSERHMMDLQEIIRSGDPNRD